jgi:hypothetical protein
LWQNQCADPCGQGVLKRRIVPILGRAHSRPGQIEQGITCLPPPDFAIEQGQQNAGLPRAALPIVQRLSKRRQQRAMDTKKDSGAGFRLTRRAADHNARGTNLNNLQLRRANVVAIKAASRRQSPAGLQAAISGAHLKAGNGERTRSNQF